MLNMHVLALTSLLLVSVATQRPGISPVVAPVASSTPVNYSQPSPRQPVTPSEVQDDVERSLEAQMIESSPVHTASPRPAKPQGPDFSSAQKQHFCDPTYATIPDDVGMSTAQHYTTHGIFHPSSPQYFKFYVPGS
jgi:hypothetical protein